MPESRFTAACLQMRSGRDPGANRDAAVAGDPRSGGGRGAAYVQTPEMTSLVERSRERLFAQVTSEDAGPDPRGPPGCRAGNRYGGADRLDRGARGRQDRQPRLPDRRRRRHPRVLRQAPPVRCRPAERRALAGIGDLFGRGLRGGRRHALGHARPDDLLRHPFPRALPGPRRGRSRGPDRASLLHAPDRRGALARPPEGAGDRDRILRDLGGAGRHARGRARDLRPFADRRSLGSRPRRCRRVRSRHHPGGDRRRAGRSMPGRASRR